MNLNNIGTCIRILCLCAYMIVPMNVCVWLDSGIRGQSSNETPTDTLKSVFVYIHSVALCVYTVCVIVCPYSVSLSPYVYTVYMCIYLSSWFKSAAVANKLREERTFSMWYRGSTQQGVCLCVWACQPQMASLIWGTCIIKCPLSSLPVVKHFSSFHCLITSHPVHPSFLPVILFSPLPFPVYSVLILTSCLAICFIFFYWQSTESKGEWLFVWEDIIYEVSFHHSFISFFFYQHSCN